MNDASATSPYPSSDPQHSATLAGAGNPNSVLRPECIECGAEPGEACFSYCGNGCQTCVDEAAGFVLVPPHTCEDEW